MRINVWALMRESATGASGARTNKPLSYAAPPPAPSRNPKGRSNLGTRQESS